MSDSCDRLDGFSDSASQSGSSITTVSLTDIKARLLVIRDKRAKEGVPTPTQEFPYPAEGAHCSLCKREYRKTKNPINNRKCPFLEPCRPGSSTCYSCRNCRNWAARGLTQDALLARNKSEREQEKWILLVYLWEDRHQDPTNAAVRVAEQLPDSLSAKVVHEMSTSIESVLCVGVFWPTAVYRRIVGEPHKRDVESFTHNGVVLKGVFRDQRHGVPMGTITVNQRCENKARKLTELCSSDSAARGHDAVKDLFSALSGRMDVTATVLEKEKGMEDVGADIKLKVKKAQLDDGLDDIWNDLPVAISSTSKATGSKRAGGAKDGNSSEASTKRPRGGKKEYEFDVSEQHILKARQLLDRLQNNGTATEVSQKKYNSILEGINSRLKQSLLDIYGADYGKDVQSKEVAATRNGMTILRDLRELQTLLGQVGSLVEVICAQKVEASTLVDACEKAASAGVAIVPSVTIKAWAAVLDDLWERSEFENWTRCLLLENSTLPKSLASGVKPEDVQAFLEKHVVDKLLSLLRGEGNADTLRSNSHKLAGTHANTFSYVLPSPHIFPNGPNFNVFACAPTAMQMQLRSFSHASTELQPLSSMPLSTMCCRSFGLWRLKFDSEAKHCPVVMTQRTLKVPNL